MNETLKQTLNQTVKPTTAFETVDRTSGDRPLHLVAAAGAGVLLTLLECLIWQKIGATVALAMALLGSGSLWLEYRRRSRTNLKTDSGSATHVAGPVVPASEVVADSSLPDHAATATTELSVLRLTDCSEDKYEIDPGASAEDGVAGGHENERDSERETRIVEIEALLKTEQSLVAELRVQLADAEEREAMLQQARDEARQAVDQLQVQHHALGTDISLLAEQLSGQVVVCLAEAEKAISTAIEAFTRIAGEAQEATGLAQQAVGTDTEHSVSSIATRATDVMEKFIEGMLAAARRISESSRRLDRLGEISDRLFGLLDDVETVADQTTMIALNASIEAARAGSAGRTFTVVAREVSKLAQVSRDTAERMRSMTEELSYETRNINTELSLTAESSLEESCNAQLEVNHLLELLFTADQSTQGVLTQLGERSANITANYASIVMAFQFHDLLRQRLEHVAQPLTQLSTTLKSTVGSGAGAGGGLLTTLEAASHMANSENEEADGLAYAVGDRTFHARAVGAAPTLTVVTYSANNADTDGNDDFDNITLF